MEVAKLGVQSTWFLVDFSGGNWHTERYRWKQKKGQPGNGKWESKAGKSYYWLSLCVPASSSVLDHYSLEQDNKLTCSAHTNCVQPVPVVRRTGRVLGAPFPDSRGALRTDGLSMLLSPCQCHFQAWWHHYLSKQIPTKTLNFFYRQIKSSGVDSRLLINCCKA